MYPQVGGLSVELPAIGRDDGGAGCILGPLNDQSLGDSILAHAVESIPSPQASGGPQLAQG